MPEISKFFGWCMLAWAALSNVGGSVAMKYFHRAKAEAAASDLLLSPNLKFLAAALFCYASSFVAYLIVLKVIPVSVAYPLITGLTILMLLGFAGAVLGETVTLPMALGSACIVLGIFLIGGQAS